MPLKIPLPPWPGLREWLLLISRVGASLSAVGRTASCRGGGAVSTARRPVRAASRGVRVAKGAAEGRCLAAVKHPSAEKLYSGRHPEGDGRGEHRPQRVTRRFLD
ncbi:hypothetical protein GCM10022402_34030 [Salinactinospora qingdaonensis]|uniref:Uncharacterized protein n=1 Tax=Salinactinospora qingdaonensis TaxID=702744 RepID=A0ABP7G1D9_9ACTN